MKRDKLKKLGIDLPLLPTTSVGSLPKSPELMEARTLLRKEKITKETLEKQEKDATIFWIKKQEELGIDVFVDGEQYRGDMVEYFAENMDGFKISGLVRSYGNRYYRKPIITSKIQWRDPITVDRWKFAQSMTKKPLKGMLTGPYTIMDWSFNDYYKTREAATLALAEQIRKEVEALIKAGAKIIQIDEPALSTRINEVPLALKALKAVTEGLESYFITHCCYGEFHKIYDQIISLPVDNLDLEMSNSNLDLLDILAKKSLNSDISFGVVDVHSKIIETKDIVKGRIQKILSVCQAEKVWIDPDCGLKTRTQDEAIGKLKSIEQAVQEIRRNL